MIVSLTDENDWYMAKAAEKWGPQETYTEFFISRLGEALGFRMAHSGLVRLDGALRFISRNFLRPGESLTHGSILLESFFECDLDKVGKNPWDEQRTYDVDMIDELLKHYCVQDYREVLAGFVTMLVFDALIGSMDRHMQNWGVIVSTTEPRSHRFAPIFDSARALFWNYTEERLQQLIANQDAMHGYANRARPKVGCARFGSAVNHFRLLEYLAKRFPVEVRGAVPKVTLENVRKSAKILADYPFRRVFTALRRDAIVRLLELRSARIRVAVSGEGEGHV